MATLVVEREEARQTNRMINSSIHSRDLFSMDGDGDGKVTEVEFLSSMLIKTNAADEDIIAIIRKRFKVLDVDGNGYLDEQDLNGGQIKPKVMPKQSLAESLATWGD